MTRLPPRSTRTCTLIPVPTLFRSAGDADVRNQRLPNVGATRHEVQHLTRHTGLEQQTHGTCGDQRCLWCRLGDDGVTRKQRRTDLADEDRQREVPRTDAREYATADELQFRSEEHTSELQSLMRISYAVFCLKKKKKQPNENLN